VVLFLAALGAILGCVFALRLGLIVLASPASVWLSDFAPLTASVGEADPFSRRLAETLSDNFADNALVRSRLAICEGELAAASEAPDLERRASALSHCLRVVDDGLRAVPVSSELWLARVRYLSNSGIFDETLQTALRRSYETGPREGWIGANRLVVALRLKPLLPPEFDADIQRDIGIVLESRSLAAPFVDAYVTDAALREVAGPMIEALPNVAAQERFVGWVRSRVNAATPT
jgi:hypothetical protein